MLNLSPELGYAFLGIAVWEALCLGLRWNRRRKARAAFLAHTRRVAEGALLPTYCGCPRPTLPPSLSPIAETACLVCGGIVLLCTCSMPGPLEPASGLLVGGLYCSACRRVRGSACGGLAVGDAMERWAREEIQRRKDGDGE